MLIFIEISTICIVTGERTRAVAIVGVSASCTVLYAALLATYLCRGEASRNGLARERRPRNGRDATDGPVARRPIVACHVARSTLHVLRSAQPHFPILGLTRVYYIAICNLPSNQSLSQISAIDFAPASFALSLNESTVRRRPDGVVAVAFWKTLNMLTKRRVVLNPCS